jgi:hypothetical protein
VGGNKREGAVKSTPHLNPLPLRGEEVAFKVYLKGIRTYTFNPKY